MQKKTLIVNKTNLLAFKDMIGTINLDENSIIIVPDKFSLCAEKLFFEEKNILASFSTQVFSMTKLASKVLSEKLNDKKIIDKNISLMIISSIISENLHKFKYFKNIKNINQISEDVFNVISQMLSSNINEYNKDISGNLKDKFEDLELILNSYLLKREEFLIDASKKYELFLNEIKNSSFIQDKNFYFGMFTSLTKQVKDIIKEIEKYAKSVCFATSQSENQINNNEIFDFYKSFNPIIYNGKTSPNKISNFIENNFFSLNKNKMEVGEKIKIFEANNIDDEIDNLILQIKKDIFLEGRRFKDISVCLSNADKYKDKLISKLNEHNISYFLDIDIKLIDNSFAKFVLSFFNLLVYSSANKILNFVKSPYIEIDETIKNNFERFLQKYSLTNKIYLNEFTCFSQDIFYKDYLYIYKKIVKKIEKFKKTFNNIDVYQFFNDFNALLEEFGAKNKLKEKTELYLNNDILKFKQFRQIDDKILEIEKSICEFYNEEFSINKIENFIKICFENTTISVPATSVDSVFIGDYQNSYFLETKCLYCLGLDSTSFPSLKPDIALFTDAELEKLEKDNRIEPKLKDANKLNYYKAFQSLLNFSDKITLSYSIMDERGNRQFPSNIYKNFCSRFLCNGDNIKILKTNIEILENFEENEILNLLSLKLNSKIDYLKKYFSLNNGKEKSVLKQVLINYYKIDEAVLNDNIYEEIAEENNVNKNLIKLNGFSASNLENYFTCPNKFLYNNLFKLKKFEPIKLDAKTLGNIVHACCYNLAQEIFLENKNTEQNFNDNLSIQNKIIKNNSINKKINYDNIINRVLKSKEFNVLFNLENSNEILNNLSFEIKKLFDFIIFQQQNSEFKLKRAEYKFEYEYNGIKFKGFVDRIDENENEFLVIDYKTGNTKIEYSEIVFCKKIQLILYAKILEKILNKKCRGIYYLSINDDFSTTEKMKIYLNGITRNTDNAIYRSDNSVFVDKSIKSNFFEFKEKYLLSENQFNNLLNKTFDKVLEIANLIKNGSFDSSPLILDEVNSCDYCDYSEICKNKKKRKETFSQEMLEKLLNDKE